MEMRGLTGVDAGHLEVAVLQVHLRLVQPAALVRILWPHRWPVHRLECRIDLQLLFARVDVRPEFLEKRGQHGRCVGDEGHGAVEREATLNISAHDNYSRSRW